MPLTVLGNNPVNVEDGWVLYDPISLQSNRTYLMEFEVFTSQPELLYSSFVARYAYPSQNTPIVGFLDLHKFYWEAVRQAFEFTIPPTLAATGNCIFAVRRFPFYSNPSALATCTVALAIDPAIFY